MTLPFQTRLILFCTVTFALLLAALSFASYRLLAQQLDVDASADLTELTEGLHGYLRIEDGTPTLVFDEKDADQATFVHTATRYYQIYDGKDGRLLVQSPGLEPLGLGHGRSTGRSGIRLQRDPRPPRACRGRDAAVQLRAGPRIAHAAGGAPRRNGARAPAARV